MINENFFYNKIKSKNTFQFNLNETSKYKNISKIPILPTKRTLTNPNNISIPERAQSRKTNQINERYTQAYTRNPSRVISRNHPNCSSRDWPRRRERRGRQTPHTYSLSLSPTCARHSTPPRRVCQKCIDPNCIPNIPHFLRANISPPKYRRRKILLEILVAGISFLPIAVRDARNNERAITVRLAVSSRQNSRKWFSFWGEKRVWRELEGWLFRLWRFGRWCVVLLEGGGCVIRKKEMLKRRWNNKGGW